LLGAVAVEHAIAMTESPLSSAQESREELMHDLDRRFRRPLISYFAKRLRVDPDVDDLVQEVFIRLSLRGGIEGIDCLDAFVFQTAANVMRDRFRRQAVRRVNEHDPLEISELPTNDFSPERVLQSKQLLDRALEALSELPARTRDIFVLRLYEGLKLEDIARSLGMSVEGVRFHLRRAKAHLARALERIS
jgi:RNA polymerase sigma factor (sigma-70 family)